MCYLYILTFPSNFLPRSGLFTFLNDVMSLKNDSDCLLVCFRDILRTLIAAFREDTLSLLVLL